MDEGQEQEALSSVPGDSGGPRHRLVIPVTSFSDSGEFGFELRQVETLVQSGVDPASIHLCFDFRPLRFDWDAASDGEEHEFMPGSLGVPALSETHRALWTAANHFPGIALSALLPPQTHPAAQLLLESGMLAGLPSDAVQWESPQEAGDRPEGAGLDLRTIVPFTYVGPATSGVLGDAFYQQFDSLADRSGIGEDYRRPLRRVLMELAENGDAWGDGCVIACFLRQEKGRSMATRGQVGLLPFDPRRHTHLFMSCITLGRTLAGVTGHATEWEAAQAVLSGYSSRSNGGGSGMEAMLHTVVNSAQGTVYLSTGNYVRVVSPNGLVHEYTLGGDHYLPGVHTCLLIPLAVVAQVSRARSA